MGFWKNLAKIALPIGAAVAAPFTGGASMAALLAGGAGAASGAIDGGWKGALKGGALGAVTGGIANKVLPAMGIGKAAVQGAGQNSTIANLLANANVPMGKLITDPNATSAGGPSFWSKLLGAGKNVLMDGGKGQPSDQQPGQGWADAGSVLGGARSNEMAQRMVKGEFMQNYDKLNLAASEENRNRENDAMKNLARTSYISSGGAQPLPTRFNSGNITDLGFGPRPASDAQKQGAATLQAQLLQRLTPEGQIKPTDPNTYANPGKLENATKWGSLISNGIGAARNILG